MRNQTEVLRRQHYEKTKNYKIWVAIMRNIASLYKIVIIKNDFGFRAHPLAAVGAEIQNSILCRF